MKTFFAKLKAWIIGHKVVSIIIASVLTVGIACSIILPIALKHEHEYATTYSTDATNHWYECECGEKKDSAAHQASAVYSSDETNHWKECSACGYDLTIEAHNYNQEVATDDYLKTAATATTKAVYYKSCVCGKAGTETFEADKTTATLTNIVMSGKVYDGTAVVAPTFDKNSDGAVTIEYSVKDANTFTTTAPIDAGEYTVRISVAETSTYSSVVATQDFTIAPIVIDNISHEFTYNTYEFQNITVPVEQLAECDASSTFLINFSFVTGNVGAEIEEMEIVEYVDYSFVATSNYVLGNNVTASIVKKGLVHLTVTKVYDGNTSISDYAISGTGIYEDDELLVSAEFNSANVAEANTLTNIVLTGAAAGNYKFSDTLYIHASITKANATIGDVNVDGKTYDGNAINAPMYTVDMFVANADVVVEYKVKGADDSAYTTTAPTDAGEYTVRVKISDSTNYNGATKTADFTIEKATASITSVAMSANSIVYGDSYEVMVEKENYDGEVIIEYKAKNADDATYEMIKPVNAGEYTARVTLSEGVNNTGDVETINFVITAKVLDDLYEIAIENGDSEFTFSLEEIESGLSVRITFEDSSAGADVTNVVILKEGNFCANYVVDLDECYFAIISNIISNGSLVYVTPANYTINLVEGAYVVEVGNVTGNRDAQVQIYSKADESTPIYEFDLKENFAFEISAMESGEYIVKVLASADGYFMINEHNVHGTLDDRGFCTTCGKYTGLATDTNTNEVLQIIANEKAYYRFDIGGEITDPDLKLNIKFADDSNITFTAYDDYGNVMDLTTDPKSFVATNSVYVVVEASAEVNTFIMVEETY